MSEKLKKFVIGFSIFTPALFAFIAWECFAIWLPDNIGWRSPFNVGLGIGLTVGVPVCVIAAIKFAMDPDS